MQSKNLAFCLYTACNCCIGVLSKMLKVQCALYQKKSTFQFTGVGLVWTQDLSNYARKDLVKTLAQKCLEHWNTTIDGKKSSTSANQCLSDTDDRNRSSMRLVRYDSNFQKFVLHCIFIY